MRKKLFAVIMLLVAASSFSYGQYFTREYLNTPLEFTNWGEVCPFGDEGNLITGQAIRLYTPTYKQAVVVRADPDGVFTNGVSGFGYKYYINHQSYTAEMSTCFGSQSDPDYFDIGGTYNANGNEYFYHGVLDSRGNPVIASAYSADGYSDYEAYGIYNDLSSGIFHILGTSYDISAGRRMATIIAVQAIS